MCAQTVVMFHLKFQTQQDKIDKIEGNIDQAQADVQQGTLNLGKVKLLSIHQLSETGKHSTSFTKSKSCANLGLFLLKTLCIAISYLKHCHDCGVLSFINVVQ